MRNRRKPRRRTFSNTEPFRVHIENETKLMPVFAVYPNEYEAVLKRHSDVGNLIQTTWGIDGSAFSASPCRRNR